MKKILSALILGALTLSTALAGNFDVFMNGTDGYGDPVSYTLRDPSWFAGSSMFAYNQFTNQPDLYQMKTGFVYGEGLYGDGTTGLFIGIGNIPYSSIPYLQNDLDTLYAIIHDVYYGYLEFASGDMQGWLAENYQPNLGFGDADQYLNGEHNRVDMPSSLSYFTNDVGYITGFEMPENVSYFVNDAGYITGGDLVPYLLIDDLEGALDYGTVRSINGQTGHATIDIPTLVSQLTNDRGYITGNSISGITGAIMVLSGDIANIWEVLPMIGDVAYEASGAVANLSGRFNSLVFPVASVNTKTGVVVLVKGDVGLGNVDNTSDLDKPISTAVQTALNGKQATITGNNISWINNNVGYVTGIVTSGLVTGGQLANLVTNTQLSSATGVIQTALNGKQNSLTGNSGQYVLGDGSYKSNLYAQTGTARSLNSAFQISTSKDALVTYSARINTTATIAGGQEGAIILEIASDSGFTTNVQEVSRIENGNAVSLAVILQSEQKITSQLHGFVPAGYYVRLRTVQTTGTPTFTFVKSQEVLMK